MKRIHEIQYDAPPLIVAAKTCLSKALERLVKAQETPSASTTSISRDYVLVVDNQNSVGLLEARDFIHLAVAGINLETTPIHTVIQPGLITVTPEELQDSVAMLNHCRQAQVRHISIVDAGGSIRGVVNSDHIIQSLASADLLHRTKVGDILRTSVPTVQRSTPLFELLKIMSQQQVSCGLVCNAQHQNLPVGIVTEWDILQCLNQSIDLQTLICETVMASPIQWVDPNESLWIALQTMQEQRIHHLVVSDNSQVVGIVTPVEILSAFDGIEVQSRMDLRHEKGDIRGRVSQEIVQDLASHPVCEVASAAQQFEFQFTGVLTPDGTLLEVNQTALQFGDLQRRDVIGKKFWQAPWWTHSSQVQQNIEAAIAQAAQGTFIHDEVEVHDGRRNFLTVDLSLRPVFNDQSQLAVIFLEARDIRDRKQAEQQLHHQHSYEALIATIATTFINLKEPGVNAEFHKAAQQLGELFEAETSFLFQMGSDETFSMTHEWVQTGFEPRKPRAQSLLYANFSGFLQQLESQPLIRITSLAEATQFENNQDSATFLQLGFQALLIIPICIQGKLIAFFGFAQFSEPRDWQEMLGHQLPLIGEVFGNALARLQTLAALRTQQLHLEDLVQQKTAALSESEERFRIMADHSPVLIWVSDPSHERYYFNQPWLEFTGRSLAQELKEGWATHIHPDDRARFFNVFQYASEEHTQFSVEYRLQRQNGEYRWLMDQGVPRFLEDGTFCGYVGSCIDVTERIKTEQALLESEERFQLAITGSEDGLFDWDLENNQIYLSPRFKQILGYQDHELHNTVQNWKSHLYLSDRESVLQALTDHLYWRRPFSLEHRMYTAQEKYCWVHTCGTAVWNQDGTPIRLVASIRDVSQRKEIERELYREKELAQITLHSIGDAVITTDADGKIEYFNPVAEFLTGWRADKVLKQSVRDVFHIVHESSGQPIEIPIFEALKTGKTVKVKEHTVLQSLGGETYNIEDSAAPIRSRQGEILGAVMVFHDVTDSRQLAKKLSWQASHDALTHLINRREFEYQLIKEIHHLETNSSHVLCFLDLDRFKIINDSCGHLAGDELLRQISKLLQNYIRSSDHLARLGGDEFGLLLKDCHLKDALIIADKIRDGVQSYRFAWTDQLFSVGISIGLMHITSSNQRIEDVLSAADAACYAAKERGRNRVHLYTTDDRQLSQQRSERQWSIKIQRALEENRYQLFFQNIVPTNQNSKTRSYHAEILVRMVSPAGELILPGMFLPSAERYDLMPALDRWVIRHSLEKIAQIQQLPSLAHEYPNAWMLNLSGASLGDESLLEFVLAQIQETQVNPKTIGFEITETAAIANLDQANHLMRSLQDLGCRFALDDFGSGMSSFGYLQSFPVNYLKIDGQFMRNIHKEAPVKAIVEAINHVGHVMNIQTIAERVETLEQENLLQEIGVDYLQGFGIHKPQPLTVMPCKCI